MSSFASLNLFSSGPHRFHIGGLSLRHALAEPPGSRGVQLTAQGTPGRAITQTGVLLADDSNQMKALLDAIEAKLDGLAHQLVADTGRAFAGVVMLSFEPEAATRIGPRMQTRYRIHYLQLTP